MLVLIKFIYQKANSTLGIFHLSLKVLYTNSSQALRGNDKSVNGKMKDAP